MEVFKKIFLKNINPLEGLIIIHLTSTETPRSIRKGLITVEVKLDQPKIKYI